MEESGKFWEQLIFEWVAITLVAFVLQGVWFGLAAFLVRQQPGWEAGLTQVSANFLKVWVVGILGALAWSVKRARSGDS